MNTGGPQAQRQSSSRSSDKDCLECRVIGTGALGGSSLYVLYHQQQIPRGTNPLNRLSLALFSAALGAGAVWRWFA